MADLTPGEQRLLLEALAWMVRDGAVLGDAWRWNIPMGTLYPCPSGADGETVARHIIARHFHWQSLMWRPRLPLEIARERRFTDIG